MKVNEMVFFDMLRIIHKRLDEAYMHALLPTSPMKTIEDHKRRISRFWDSMTAVREAKDDLEMLLSLVMEDPQHIALQGQHNLKKDKLYELLGINKPIPGPPIGAARAYPVRAVKAEPEKQEESIKFLFTEKTGDTPAIMIRTNDHVKIDDRFYWVLDHPIPRPFITADNKERGCLFSAIEIKEKKALEIIKEKGVFTELNQNQIEEIS